MTGSFFTFQFLGIRRKLFKITDLSSNGLGGLLSLPHFGVHYRVRILTDYAADKGGRSDKALYRGCLLPNIDFYLDINLSLGMESRKEPKQRV